MSEHRGDASTGSTIFVPIHNIERLPDVIIDAPPDHRTAAKNTENLAATVFNSALRPAKMRALSCPLNNTNKATASNDTYLIDH